MGACSEGRPGAFILLKALVVLGILTLLLGLGHSVRLGARVSARLAGAENNSTTSAFPSQVWRAAPAQERGHRASTAGLALRVFPAIAEGSRTCAWHDGESGECREGPNIPAFNDLRSRRTIRANIGAIGTHIAVSNHRLRGVGNAATEERSSEMWWRGEESLGRSRLSPERGEARGAISSLTNRVNAVDCWTSGSSVFGLRPRRPMGEAGPLQVRGGRMKGFSRPSSQFMAACPPSRMRLTAARLSVPHPLVREKPCPVGAPVGALAGNPKGDLR